MGYVLHICKFSTSICSSNDDHFYFLGRAYEHRRYRRKDWSSRERHVDAHSVNFSWIFFKSKILDHWQYTDQRRKTDILNLSLRTEFAFSTARVNGTWRNQNVDQNFATFQKCFTFFSLFNIWILNVRFPMICFEEDLLFCKIKNLNRFKKVFFFATFF